MTWSEMSHEAKELKNMLTNEDGEVIGFTLSGMTYDGDGNPQWEEGTDMEIVFENNEQLKKIIERISSSM